MIYTLSVNPAVDRTITVDEINDVDVSKVIRTTRDAAGKGINVAKAIHSYGNEVVCLGFIGGPNGDFIINELDELQLDNAFISIGQETRENIKVHDQAGRLLEFNEKGGTVTTDEYQVLLKQLDEVLNPGDILVVTGSLSPGLDNRSYADIISFCNSIGVVTVLDASRSVLELALHSKPTIIKPNKYELEQYAGHPIYSTTDIIRIAMELYETGINTVIVSMGRHGSVCINQGKTYRISPIEVEVQSTVGAGDNFVAGFVTALDQGKDVVTCLKLATAFASASIEKEGTTPGDSVEIERLYSLVDVQEL